MTIETVADIIRSHAVATPDRLALVLDDRRVTWGELYERARRVATGLIAAGIGPQDHVALLDKNGIEHFELSFGAALADVVPVDINWRLAPPEVAFIVDDCACRLLVVGAEFVPVLEAMRDDLAADLTVLVIGDHPDHESFDAWVDRHADVDPNVPVAVDDTALQLYSSGTTGRPKGVMLTNPNLFGLLPAGVALWGIDADSVNLAAMPMFHIGGSGWALAGQFAGATTVLMRELDPARLVALVGRERVTHGFLVPAVLQFMLMVPGVAEADFSSLRMLAYGASPISDDVLRRSIETFGCDFWQVYGLTETTGAIVNLPPEDHDLAGPNRHRLRSCGVAGPGVELRIVDHATGRDIAPGAGGDEPEVGEILVRGIQVMKGYWNQPAATADAVDADGWFRTGDAGYLDADGYLYIHDRVKDMIVSGGENVYPAEVENVLMGHPGIADVAVIGVPDDRWGEAPKAIVVAAGEPPDPGDVIAYARGQLARFKCPTSVEYVAALPRNPSGKILKRALRAPYWEGRDRQVN